MEPTGHDKLSSQQRDNETLAEAIRRQKEERDKREPLLTDQGKIERGLNEPKV
jgi:hypothetical protein